MAEAQPPTSLHHIKAILFDLDGTLVETDNRWASQLSTRLHPLQRILPRLNPDALGRWLVMAIESPSNYAVSIAEHVGLGKAMLGLADRVRKSKGVATRGASEQVAGTRAMLEKLAPDFKLGVVTTRARPEAMSFVQQLDLSDFFPVVVTRSDVFRMKPSPHPVLRGAEMLGVAPEHCIMVGDTTMDVRAAKRAGAVAVAVLSGFGERRELERAGADLVLDRAEQLLAYL